MFARVAILCIGIAVAGPFLSGCAKKTAPPPITHMTVVTGAGGLGDHAFNDAAKAGDDACHEETGIVPDVVTPASAADIEPQLVLAATKKTDTVVAIGYPAAQAVMNVARRFESVHFVLIDAIADQPNVESITFAEEQGAFLAGALAARVSKSHRIGFIGGADIPLIERSEAGFTAGAREADPQVRVAVRYLTSFEDRAPARAAADALLKGGADVLFAVAGPAGGGAFDAVAAAPDAFAIGSDADQSGLAPGKVLASVVKRVDAATLRVCRETVGGKPASGRLVLGVADDGIGLAALGTGGAPVDPAAIAEVDRVRDALIAHRLTAPRTRAELAHFKPLALPSAQP